MYVERSQPIVRSCRALKRGFFAGKKAASQARATACDRLRPLAPPNTLQFGRKEKNATYRHGMNWTHTCQGQCSRDQMHPQRAFTLSKSPPDLGMVLIPTRVTVLGT